MAKKTTMLKQMEMFDKITSSDISPNQYYLLCCIRDNISAIKINLHLEIRSLVTKGFIISLEGNQTKGYKLTPEAHTLIDGLEKFFKINKTKTSNSVMGLGYKENIKTYKEMFPHIKLPSGKPARSSDRNLQTNFRWFFERYNYDWETVLKATAYYVNKGQKENWKFMRTSMYFIKKDGLSDLADVCEIILTGGDEDEEATFKTRVV